MKKYKNVWIALACVIPMNKDNKVLDFNEGAFVNVLSSAVNVKNFVDDVMIALQEFDLKCHGIEDCELFEDRKLKYSAIDDKIYKLAKQAGLTSEVQFGTFHSFPKNELAKM